MNQRILIFFFQASLRNCINCVHCDNNFFIFWTSIAGKKPFSWLKYRKLDLYRLRRYSTWNRARLCCIRKSWSKVKLIGRILSAQNSNFYFLDTLSLQSWSGWERNNPRAIYSFEWSQFKFLEACGSLHSYALIGRLQKSGKHKLLYWSVFLKSNEVWLPPPIHSRWELKQNNIDNCIIKQKVLFVKHFVCRYPVGKYPLLMDWIIFLVENIPLASIQSICRSLVMIGQNWK